MTVKEYVLKTGWQAECDTCVPNRSMDVNIMFQNQGFDDETQFTINSYDLDELDKLYETFCKEEDISCKTVDAVTIVAVYETKPECIVV